MRPGIRGRSCLDQESFGFGEDSGVALDASLGVEKEVVSCPAGFQLLDGVGDHTVEPADAIVSGDANPACLSRAAKRPRCEAARQAG